MVWKILCLHPLHYVSNAWTDYTFTTEQKALTFINDNNFCYNTDYELVVVFTHSLDYYTRHSHLTPIEKCLLEVVEVN